MVSLPTMKSIIVGFQFHASMNICIDLDEERLRRSNERRHFQNFSCHAFKFIDFNSSIVVEINLSPAPKQNSVTKSFDFIILFVYVCIRACVCSSVCVSECVCAYVRVCVCMCMFTYVCVYTTYIYTYIFVHIYIYIYIYMYT